MASLIAASAPAAAQEGGAAGAAGDSAGRGDPGPAPSGGPGEAARLASRLDRAETLFREGLRLEAEPRRRRRAARAYLESARLRPYGDLEAYVALERAGAVFADLGKRRKAEEAFVRAAVRALESGRVYEASLAFVSASELARDDPGAGDRLLDYDRQAARLSESPRLTEAQRRDVRRRLGAGGGA